MPKLSIPVNPNGIEITSIDSWTTNSIGTSFLLVTLSDGQQAGIHEDSVEAFDAERSDDNILPSDWALSKSRILFKKVARTGSNPWKF